MVEIVHLRHHFVSTRVFGHLLVTKRFLLYSAGNLLKNIGLTCLFSNAFVSVAFALQITQMPKETE